MRLRVVLLAAFSAVLMLALALPARATFPGSNGKILFLRYSGNQDIWSINPDGSGLSNLTTSPENEFNLATSPDGTHLAFTTGDVWVMKNDGTGRTLLFSGPINEQFLDLA